GAIPCELRGGARRYHAQWNDRPVECRKRPHLHDPDARRRDAERDRSGIFLVPQRHSRYWKLFRHQCTSALSVTIPTSSTLGFANATPGRIWLAAINNAGTVELAVINCLTSTATSKSIYPLAGWGIINTTALGGPSNSSGVFYSTIARSSVPY